ncbi:MAG: transglutaminase domain-containing protein [Deltaproteobacteria bacterium]|nr:transglutaminase domain-containing protein [Deltaproteobacteria bacterium]
MALNWQQRMAMVPAVMCTVVALWWFGNDPLAWLPGGLAVISIFVGHRVALDNIGQLILALVWAALVYAVYFVWREVPAQTPERLDVIGQVGALFCVGIVAMRLWMLQPVGRDVTTAIVLLTGWLFLGLGPQWDEYLILAAVSVLAVLAGVTRRQLPVNNNVKQRYFNWSTAGVPVNRGGVLARLAGVALISASISSVFIVAIPKAYAWVEERYLNSMSFSTTGFSPALALGSVNQMFVSSDIAARVFTTRRDIHYLRGVVYNKYSGHHWIRTIPNASTRVDSSSSNISDADMKMIFSTPQHRLFAPLRFSALMSEGRVQKDELGLVSVDSNDEITAYAVQLSQRAEEPHILHPVPDDLAVPVKLQTSLAKWLATYAGSGENEATTLVAIRNALQQKYTYSLTFTRPGGKDALLNFLWENREGHCEYFASAFALLARSASVPTRVVGGYLLKEYNTFGKYYIVREKHAHVWTEVWLNGTWVIMDPTPAGGAGESGASVVAAVDFVWVLLQDAFGRLLHVDGWVFFWGVLGLLALWGGIVWRRRRRARIHSNDVLSYTAAHEVLIRLEKKMATSLPRGKSESLEDWAQRMLGHDDAFAATAHLLREYAAWRYGDVGNITDIALRMTQLDEQSPETTDMGVVP